MTLRRSTRASALAAAATAAALAPPRRHQVLGPLSFFPAWLTSEAVAPVAALTAARTVGILRRDEHRDGQGRMALALNVAALAGTARFVVEARRTDQQFADALSPWFSAAELQSRPRSTRQGQWLPILYGGRGRRVRTRNVEFGPPAGSPRLHLDVYEPLGPRPVGGGRPAVIQVHGGAWMIGDKREQGIPLLNHLARQGWVGFNVNYRLAPRSKLPAAVIDVKRAIAWVRDHAEEYGIDPGMICITGGSAGGHLTALAALTANDPYFQPGFEDADTTVAAAVPFYGLYDLYDVSALQPGIRERFLEPLVFGVPFREDPELYRRLSPRHRIHPEAPPMMVVHGTRDALVPIESARPFAAALAGESRSAVCWVELVGAQHAFEVFPSPRSVRTVEYVAAFLDGVHRGVVK